MAGVSIILDFTLRQGSFTLEVHERFQARAVALFGPSGSGKTTVLESIAGVRCPLHGIIELNGHVLYDSNKQVDSPARFRRVGYVPQDVALFPHMDVRKNISNGSRLTGGVTSDRVIEILEVDSLLDRNVSDLSGGERQRVAIARALMSVPDVLLLDEPLAAIDQPLRERILPYIERVRDELAIPLIYVSHSEEEVQRIADRLLTFDCGRVIDSADLTPVRPLEP